MIIIFYVVRFSNINLHEKKNDKKVRVEMTLIINYFYKLCRHFTLGKRGPFSNWSLFSFSLYKKRDRGMLSSQLSSSPSPYQSYHQFIFVS